MNSPATSIVLVENLTSEYKEKYPFYVVSDNAVLRLQLLKQIQ